MIRQIPSLSKLLRLALNSEQRPSAFVLAGHNGSGKSTLWYQRLADQKVVGPFEPARPIRGRARQS